MAIMVGVVVALSAFYHDSTDFSDINQRMIACHRLIAKIPTIGAMAYKYSIGQPFVYPRNDLSYAENFLYMTFSVPSEDYKVSPKIVKAMDRFFTLHADHEQNASTSTVKIAGSEELNMQDDPLLKIAIELEKIALKDEYFISKKLFPNVDFYSGIILKALGFPTSMFTVLFAIGRTVGWISQWKEMIEDPINKIGRPRQLYTGYKARPYQVESSREKKSIFNWLWKKD